MGLNDMVSAERVHIGFFGMRNAGKSSLVNAVTGQNLSVVSDVKGTTTDPVKKSMELLPIGPVVILDTPGLDDEGYLGELRVEKAKQMLGKTDIAVLVIDASVGMRREDQLLQEEVERRKIPYLVVYHKADLVNDICEGEGICVSSLTGNGVEELKKRLGELAKTAKKERVLLADLLEAGDQVIMVTPIDESAPKGRIILPQQMALRDILDSHALATVCQVEQLEAVLRNLGVKPRMVITDSQVFGTVAKMVPEDVPLTSFSILMARYKGKLEELIVGVEALRELKDGDKVLISEGCTHHRQCNDIGTVKMPNWIREYSGANPKFHFTSGGDFPAETLGTYKVIVHCGGCMINEAEMNHRILLAKNAGVPIVNYGIAIAGMQGILERSLDVFTKRDTTKCN